MVLSPKAVLYISYVSDAVSQSFRQCIVLSNQSLESDRSHVTLTTVNNQEKQCRGLWLQNSLDRIQKQIIRHLVAETCTTCCSWHPSDEFGTFWICFHIRQWCYLSTQLYRDRLDLICFRKCCCLCHRDCKWCHCDMSKRRVCFM